MKEDLLWAPGSPQLSARIDPLDHSTEVELEGCTAISLIWRTVIRVQGFWGSWSLQGRITKRRKLCKKAIPEMGRGAPWSLWLNTRLYLCRGSLCKDWQPIAAGGGVGWGADWRFRGCKRQGDVWVPPARGDILLNTSSIQLRPRKAMPQKDYSNPRIRTALELP